MSTPVYDRDRLPLDVELRGPCVVEQMDTTTVVPPQATLRVDTLGCLRIEVIPTAPGTTGRAAVRSSSGSSQG